VDFSDSDVGEDEVSDSDELISDDEAVIAENGTQNEHCTDGRITAEGLKANLDDLLKKFEKKPKKDRKAMVHMRNGTKK